jgi:predicted secreted hydrolase
LRTPDGRHFGYQLTFFRRALLPPDQWPLRQSRWDATQAYMAHFALTDTRAGRQVAFERLSRGAAGLAGAQAEPFQVWLEDWMIEQTGAQEYRLYAAQDDIRLELTLRDLKEPVLQGDAGFSQKGPEAGNASYYFSQTRLQSQGTVSAGDASYAVSGYSWMDHEYSTSALSQGQVGWDWFSIQLNNQSELMIFQIRRDDGSIDPFSSGAYITPDGSPRRLTREDFQIDVLDTWRSPATGAAYPSRWRIQIPTLQLTLELTPHLADQELDLSYAYWEGAVSIRGQVQASSVSGDGYVEMTGYIDSNGE